MIETHNPDIICGQDSKLDQTTKTSEIFPKQYQEQTYRKDFKAGERRVFIAVRYNIIAKQMELIDNSSEAIWVKIGMQGTQPIVISSVYRHTDNDLQPIIELANDIDNELEKSANIILCGVLMYQI
jgi:exonuclease III